MGIMLKKSRQLDPEMHCDKQVIIYIQPQCVVGLDALENLQVFQLQ